MTNVIKRRCSSCHDNKSNQIFSLTQTTNYCSGPIGAKSSRLYHLLYNLARPEKSRILKFGLKKSAGGYGFVVRGKDGASFEHGVFDSTDDPDYQIILKVIKSGQSYIDSNKRWHMKGFKPTTAYVREMKRYGILPGSFDINIHPIDVRATDEAYFRSHWHYPPGQQPRSYKNKAYNQQFITCE